MKKKLFRTHAFITGIVLIGFICITIINYCTYSVVIRDDIRNISRLTSLNIFSSISNELTKPIFVSLTMANDSFLKSWLRGENDSPEQIAELQDYLNGLKRKYDYSSVFLVSAKTNIYYHYNGINKVVSRDDSHDVWYYNFVASGIPHRLEVDTDEMARNELTVFVDCRIEDDHGELMGVVGVGVKMRELQQILASFELDFDLTAFLVNREVWQSHVRSMIATPPSTINARIHTADFARAVEAHWYNNGRNLPRHPLSVISTGISLWKKIPPSLRNRLAALEGHPRRGVHHHPDPAAGFGDRIALRQIHDPVCHHGQTHRAHEPGTFQCHPEPETLGAASRIHVRRGPLQTHQRYPRPPLGQ
ncbi:MAG: cache domain-containing protein [Bilophila wadsworthia]